MRDLDKNEQARCYAEGKKASPSVSGKLKVVNSKLCDKNGEPVQLRGLSTHGLSWYPLFINRQFFNELNNVWNCNVIRLAMYTAELDGYCTGGDREGLIRIVREGVRYAKEADMYVIIDWHILSDNDPAANQEDAAQFFARMSEELKDEEHVIYEICNEPNGEDITWPKVKKYAQSIIPVIRKNDPQAVIIVGTPQWSQDVDIAAKDQLDEFENIMYALHYYATSHKDKLRNKLRAALKDGLPVFVSEYGLCDASGDGDIDDESSGQWFDLMDSEIISYIAWNISYKNETSAIFNKDCTKDNGFDEDDLTDYGKKIYKKLTTPLV